jgi:hypothetical protein
MNNPLVAEVATHLAGEVQCDATWSDARRLDRVWLTVLGRPPAAMEAERAGDFVSRASWAQLIQTLLCTNELVYLD